MGTLITAPQISYTCIYPQMLVLDGNSEIGAQVYKEFDHLICWKHLSRSTAVTIVIYFFKKNCFPLPVRNVFWVTSYMSTMMSYPPSKARIRFCRPRPVFPHEKKDILTRKKTKWVKQVTQPQWEVILQWLCNNWPPTARHKLNGEGIRRESYCEGGRAI